VSNAIDVLYNAAPTPRRVMHRCMTAYRNLQEFLLLNQTQLVSQIDPVLSSLIELGYKYSSYCTNLAIWFGGQWMLVGKWFNCMTDGLCVVLSFD
jgi:hypothetical protein